DRRAAVRKLAELDQKNEMSVVIEALERLDRKPGKVDASLVFDLVRQLTSRSPAELASARAKLEKFATSAEQSTLREIGLASLVAIDNSADQAWQLATRSTASLLDMVDAMPLVADAGLRAGLYDRIEPLLNGLPGSLATNDRTPSTMGRFVRIELPRKGTLTLAEVEVTSGGHNVARAGKASQTNTSNGGSAERAIDGNTSGQWSDGGQTHTEENTKNPWWEVDLGRELPIDSVAIYNRTDGFLGKRLQGFTLKVLAADRQEVFNRQAVEIARDHVAVQVGQTDPAVAIRHAAMMALTHARGREAKAFESVAKFVSSDQDRDAAIRALERIGRENWPKDQARPLLDPVVAYLRHVPPQQRTTPEALAALQFGHELAALLPSSDARQARAQLEELGVRVVRVGTVFERMSYDKDVLAVRAGKPVEFIFENSDLMPHNFVIAQPGSMEELGLEAERTAQQPDAAERHYVPRSNKVLLASTLVQPRGSETLSFVAPSAPGIYPYVCTYPGHWRRMYGALYVVDDLDAYLENPESYLAAHPLEVKDALLKDRRPRTEWTLDDLAIVVGDLKRGRSYANGKQIFEIANCVACHKLDGIGHTFGPELAKLDPKMRSLDILKELIEPSARINEKYQPYTFELDSGKVITGLVLDETAETLRVIENPLAKADATQVKVAEIVERRKSTASIMPKGLLDKLSRDEILDLIAFVAARGNQHDPLFQGAHDHAGHH
ncbi:MAG TPA: discoidin domain-containing protein, partial [Pirellulales bacterium]|nr:discoidin domain-containing protein [Pirellulales bacterium]